MRLKIDIPWYLPKLGVRKWLVERVFHVPDTWLPTVCAYASVTPAQWRDMEKAFAALLYDGLFKI